MISRFEGDYRFLSNFAESEVHTPDGQTYPTVEHAYQASKSFDQEYRNRVSEDKTPAKAKFRGRQVNLRSDWEAVKDRIMYRLVLEKFTASKRLQALLIGTGHQVLVEGNSWGDTYWGVCNGSGQNKLGEILMRVRVELVAGDNYTGVSRVISGGQIGADLAGLHAAEALDIETGGTATKGFRQKNGCAPWLRRYGLVEHESPQYPPRTECNVLDSDATIRLALDFDSPGELCTLRYIKHYDKPHFDFQLRARRIFLSRLSTRSTGSSLIASRRSTWRVTQGSLSNQRLPPCLQPFCREADYGRKRPLCPWTKRLRGICPDDDRAKESL